MYKDASGNVYQGSPRTDVDPESGRSWIMMDDPAQIPPSALPPGWTVVTSPEAGNGSPGAQGYQWLRGPDGQIWMPNAGDPNNGVGQFIGGTSYRPYQDVLKEAAASNQGWYNDALPKAALGALAGGVGLASGGFGLSDLANGYFGGGAGGGASGVSPEFAEWGSGEAGMSGSALNPSYANVSGVPVGTSPGWSFPSIPGFNPASLAAALTGGAGAAGGAGGGAGGAPGMGGGGNLMGGLPGIATGLYDLFAGGQKVDPAKLNTLWQAGLDTYNLSRDPQNALYDRTLQRMQDQVRAGQSARGVAMSPYGAAGEGEASKNFNIDWANNQLSRQVAGLGGLAQASGGYFGQANQDQARRDASLTSGTNALLTGFNTAFGGRPGAAPTTTGSPGQMPAPTYYGTPASFPNYSDPSSFYGGTGTSFSNPGNYYGGAIDPSMMQSYNWNASQGLPY